MEDIKRVARRPHSEALKARVLAECSQQGVSVAKVALGHGLNANLVHKWRRAAEAATTRGAVLSRRPRQSRLICEGKVVTLTPDRSRRVSKPSVGAACSGIRSKVINRALLAAAARQSCHTCSPC